MWVTPLFKNKFDQLGVKYFKLGDVWYLISDKKKQSHLLLFVRKLLDFFGQTFPDKKKDMSFQLLMPKFKLERYHITHIKILHRWRVLYRKQKKNVFGQISQNDLGVDYFLLLERNRYDMDIPRYWDPL